MKEDYGCKLANQGLQDVDLYRMQTVYLILLQVSVTKLDICTAYIYQPVVKIVATFYIKNVKCNDWCGSKQQQRELRTNAFTSRHYGDVK